jgi:hypothetical protein
MVAAIGAVFTKGRDFGAWLGLVPKQISTGDRTILGAISRHGNHYLRALFVQAAWVVLIRIKDWDRYGLKVRIDAAKNRLHHTVLAIALANKLARIAWAVLRSRCWGKPPFRLLTILWLLKCLLRTIPDAFRGNVLVARINYSSGKHTCNNPQHREASQFMRNFL